MADASSIVDLTEFQGVWLAALRVENGKIKPSMITSISGQDLRFDVLKKSRNLRWPASPYDEVRSIELCTSSADTIDALQRVISAGRRPTIRSGGHCYEDFVVNNPGGAILDLSLLTAPPPAAAHSDRYWIGAGMQLGDVYLDLFKRYGVTIPAGSCYSVGAGGHISGGGYGLLSRLHGLTVDWLSAVDILTVDAHGKVIARQIDHSTEPDLFRACRGAGAGNFGVITGYWFDKLPKPPKEVLNGGIDFDWATITEDRFVEIVLTFGDYWATRGRDADTWGLFSILDLSHSSARGFGVSVQFCNPDGTCSDLHVVNEFLDRFQSCQPLPRHSAIHGDQISTRKKPSGSPCPGQHALTREPWLDATVNGAGSGGDSRAKYKSTYMKENFTISEAKCIYKHLRRTISGVDLSGSTLAVDSYGAFINRGMMREETATWQRESIMKLQYQSYWHDRKDDQGRLQWLNDFYTDLYSGENVPRQYAGTPYPGKHYEGCYINYPDQDMLRYPFWPQLYYGDGELYPFLQDVKQRYDPHNIFHHAMSIRPKESTA